MEDVKVAVAAARVEVERVRVAAEMATVEAVVVKEVEETA